MPSMALPDVTDIELDRDAMELRVRFDDGVHGAIGLVELRLNCPCATCRAARQRSTPVWAGQGRSEVLGVRDAQLVGAWGLGITWSDGHSTGIYPFESLHTWVVSGDAPFDADSGLGP